MKLSVVSGTPLSGVPETTEIAYTSAIYRLFNGYKILLRWFN
jgi:hypothetical protein